MHGVNIDACIVPYTDSTHSLLVTGPHHLGPALPEALPPPCTWSQLDSADTENHMMRDCSVVLWSLELESQNTDQPSTHKA